MKYIAIFFLILPSTPRSFAQSQTNCSLVNSSWTFKGFLYNTKGTLNPCPEGTVYIIHFKERQKITGTAMVNYSGKYKIKKKNRIKMTLHIPRGITPDAKDLDELYCRLDYGKYLAPGHAIPYEPEGDKLKIFSNEFVTMIFERIKN